MAKMEKQPDVIFGEEAHEAILTGIADSDPVRRKPGRAGVASFFGDISVWPDPGTPGWGEPLLYVTICTSKVRGRKESTVRSRFSAVRFMRLINGDTDSPPPIASRRCQDKGDGKEGMIYTETSHNTDFLRWAHKQLLPPYGFRKLRI